MTRLFLCSHGRLASGLASSIEILTGLSDRITVFDAYLPGSVERVEDKAEEFLASCQDEDTKILLSDIYGGSVNQTLARYIDRPNTYLVTGVQLPLLLDLVMKCEENLTKEELLESVVSSREMIKLVTLDFEDRKEEDFF